MVLNKLLLYLGDSEVNNMVRRELGRATANLLARYLDKENMIVAVSGGTPRIAESVNLASLP